MNHDEIQRQLSEYLDGDLPEQTMDEIRTHLAGCAICSAELIKYQSLRSRTTALASGIAPPRDLWNGIERRISQTSQHDPAEQESPRIMRLALSAFWKNHPYAVAAAIILMVGGYWIASRHSTPAWNVTSLNGHVDIGSERIEGAGKFRVGELLVTDGSSRARVEVGFIGHVDVGPNSRLRLLDTGEKEHRLALDRGIIHATISAPPRLFFVETPSALAVDLGCAYTLRVDSTGASILDVTSGWVSLEYSGRESIVPAGNSCATRIGFGPGTPYRDDASMRFLEALTRYDFERGGTDALRVVLTEARNMDSITLWHLLFRETGENRAAAYDRLAALVPVPDGVTRAGMLSGDPGMIKAWQKQLNLGVKAWWKFWQ